MLSNFLEVILELIINIIELFFQLFTYPIYAIINAALPDFTTILSNVTNFINGTILNGISYFFYILPSGFRYVLSFWLVTLAAFFTIYIAYVVIIYVVHLVTKLTDIIF